MKARHRAEKTELRHDQAAVERRPDVLGKLTPPANQNSSPALTNVQFAAYVHHAREAAKRRAHFNLARGEVTADRQRAEESAREHPHVRIQEEKRARTEQTGSKVAAASREANKEMTSKEIERMRRAAAVDEMLAERKADRDRDRGGGRSRDR